MHAALRVCVGDVASTGGGIAAPAVVSPVSVAPEAMALVALRGVWVAIPLPAIAAGAAVAITAAVTAVAAVAMARAVSRAATATTRTQPLRITTRRVVGPDQRPLPCRGGCLVAP